MTPVSTLNDERWHIRAESTKMRIVGGFLGQVPFALWRVALESPGQNGIIEMLVRMHEQSDQRTRDLTTQVASLDGHIKLLNANLERYAKIPERMERVERFVWAGSLIAAFVGVLLGGVGQRVLSEAVLTPAKHEEHPYEEFVPKERLVHRGP
jgi:hypothetical protein